MRSRRMIPTASLALLALASLALPSATPPGQQQATLSRVADLTSAPDGERLGLLLAGAQVAVLETRDGWSRVAIEGWMRAEAGWGEPGPPAAAPATASAAPARLSGTIFLTGRKGKGLVGSGIAVRLVRDTPESRDALQQSRATCSATTDALIAEIDALQKQAETMLSKSKDATAAFQGYDAALKAKADKLKELAAADRACMTGLDAAADGHAALRTASATDGTFSFDGVVPGRYLLHAWMDADDARHEWDVPLAVEPAAAMRLDLTEANRTRAIQLPR